MAAPSNSIQDQIRAQGEVVRRLKKDNAPEETVSIVSIPYQFADILQVTWKSRDGITAEEKLETN